MRRHLVLVGLSGSGKSTVGRLMAEALATDVADIDGIIEQRTGTTIAELFAAGNEASFRLLERQAVVEMLQRPPHVVVPGAGWIEQPETIPAPETACLVYLATSVSVAAMRLTNAKDRPLLQGDLTTLLAGQEAARVARYQRAEVTIPTDLLDVARVAAEGVRVARESAGW